MGRPLPHVHPAARGFSPAGTGIEVFSLCKGYRGLEPLSFPASRGLYTEIRWRGYRFEFDLNGCIRKIWGGGKEWPHPWDWLARTQTNRWMYLSGQGYEDTFALTGGYYHLYAQGQEMDPAHREHPLGEPHVKEAFRAWDELRELLPRALALAPEGVAGVLEAILRMTPRVLARRALELCRILKATIPVLPPETHLVEYQVLPVLVAEGCTANCRFCSVKTASDFAPRTLGEIAEQIEGLRAFYGPELANYNSVFLGQNDALSAGMDMVLQAAWMAWERFELARSYHPFPRLFLFSGAEAFLSLDARSVAALERLPYSGVHVNVGVESLDGATLEILGKPLSARAARECVERAFELNRRPGPLEVGLNFVSGDSLPPSHWRLLEEALCRPGPRLCKGAAYVSPLGGCVREPRELRRRVLELKARASIPLFLYRILGL